MDLRSRRLLVSLGCCLILNQLVFGQAAMPKPPGRLIEVNGHLLHCSRKCVQMHFWAADLRSRMLCAIRFCG
jgi:hypothetical protein